MKTYLTVTIMAVGLTACAVSAPLAAAQIWTDVTPDAIAPTGDRAIVPNQFRALAADIVALDDFLSRVPLEETAAANTRAVIELPMPDGSFQQFSVVESPIMAPALGARYPDIRTYAGYGIDDPTATVRFDMTPHGFHALILRSGGSIYIDPFQRYDNAHYQSYYRSDHTSGSSYDCTVLDEEDMAAEIRELVGQGRQPFGTELRTYRCAIAATGEYTQYHGGTVADGLAEIIVALNRVTGIYEREVSIRMELIPNNDLIIYTNPNTDPYTNNNGFTMLTENQNNLDAVIGSANYDIGHVFSTGGGGVAYLGVICRSGWKARGVTGLPSPIGDRFYVDYVAHEMGHQYGANHSFNGNAGSCGGGNRNSGTAYEPGSGSTIMAYAGICGNQNLQGFSDDYFHWVSIQEIVQYSQFGSGNGCPVITPTGAIEPIVEAGTGGFSIPKSTPFQLTAEATTTGTPTFCWEEADRGNAGHPDSPVGDAPIFRSFDPVDAPTRTFPRWSNIINNTHTIGELLPSYARNLTFKMTVRDFQAGGIGVVNDEIAFDVADDGPFVVTQPNTNLTWPAGSTQTILWDVAGTSGVPVNCQSVDILLSTNSGQTWDFVLESGTPNDGSEDVRLLVPPTTFARVMIQAADNIFFDISNTNFTIETSVDVAEQAATESGLVLYANRPNPFNPQTAIRFELPRAAEVSVSVYDPAGRLVRSLVEGDLGAGTHQTLWDGLDDDGRAVSTGIYHYKLSSMGETLWGRMTLLK